MSDGKDLMYTEEQFEEFKKNLSEADVTEARRQQMVNRLVNEKPKQAPNLNNDDEYLKAVREMPYSPPQKNG